MTVTVRVPGALAQGRDSGSPTSRVSADATLVIDVLPATLGELVAVLDRQIPGLAKRLAAGGFNFVVNDEVLLHGAAAHELHDGDRIELLPAIAGG
ncbi:MAG: MoaD/ThiS family protein [Acidobacteriota bacterium]